jgi:hypothetical protein
MRMRMAALLAAVPLLFGGRAAEQLLGLPKLGKAATATSMVSAFNL